MQACKNVCDRCSAKPFVFPRRLLTRRVDKSFLRTREIRAPESSLLSNYRPTSATVGCYLAAYLQRFRETGTSARHFPKQKCLNLIAKVHQRHLKS